MARAMQKHLRRFRVAPEQYYLIACSALGALPLIVFSIRLTTPGTYRFVCSIHAPGMRMTPIVR
jgi:hypothetical protein